MRWWAELLGSRVTQSKESDAFASQGVERLIRPLLPNWADSRLGGFKTTVFVHSATPSAAQSSLWSLSNRSRARSRGDAHTRRAPRRPAGWTSEIVNLERDDYLCRPSRPGRELPVERE